MGDCQHLDFNASVGVGRIMSDVDPEKLLRLSVEVRVECQHCGVSLEFQGLPMGIDTHGPTMSPDGLEARLVAMPKGKGLLAEGRIAAIFRQPEGRS